MFFKTLLALGALAVVQAEPGQTLTVAASGGHESSPLLFGALFEDLYHSGDGGLYAELIRNRAFQGGTENNGPTLKRSTQFWHTIGNCQLSVETTTPYLSSSLPWSMKLTVPAGTKGKVGFYNDGFFGMHVDQAKRYAGSFNIRGAYNGNVVMGFRNKLTTKGLSNQTVAIKSTAGAWTSVDIPVFQPTASSNVADNTFEFLFDGAALAGKTVNFNLFSVFKQTYKDRYNGVREDLANVYDGLSSTWVRLPGGNNMQGFNDGEEFRFNETIGDLKNRPGRRGTWTDIDTSGFGMLEQMQWAVDAKQQIFLGIYAGLHIGGGVVPKEKLQPYVQLALNQIEFLVGDSSTTWGKVRANLGFPQPFDLKHVEIGNEDFFGEPSYSDYRWDAFYKPIRAKYPNLILISTVSPAPNGLGVKDGVWADEHIYENEDNMAKLYSRYDNHDRTKPVIVGEYATVVRGSNPGQEGYQTMGMTMSEAIMMLGGERNSDIVKGIAHGALIKAYTEEPGTVALIKHTAGPDIVKSNTYYLSQLFSQYHGDVTLPVSTAGGLGLGPVYWSATKSNGGSTYLKLVNYHGPGSAVYVAFQGAHSATAQVITFTAPDCGSINNIPSAGGETSSITKTTINEQNGKFAVYFVGECEIKILVV